MGRTRTADPSAREGGMRSPCQTCGAPAQAGVQDRDWSDWSVCSGCAGGDLHRAVTGLLRARGHAQEADEVSSQDVGLLHEHGWVPALAYWAGVPGMSWRVSGDETVLSNRAERAPVYSPEQPVQRAWEHVSEADLAWLLDGVSRLPTLRSEAGLVDTSCTTGSCAWCGAYTSDHWHDEGSQWADDGSPAPLCHRCWLVFDRHRDDFALRGYDAQRAGISEALTGVPCGLGEKAPSSLRAFAEVAGPGHVGGEPWAHLSATAVQEYRLDVWGAYNGHYAPKAWKALAVAHATEKERRWRERSEQTRLEHEAQASGYHF
jgi:hypothetical protein